MRQVPYVDFPAQFEEERAELMPLIEGVFRRGEFILGPAVEALERDLAAYCGTAEAVAVNSGTDALVLGLRALGVGPGDEVITPPNSFVASTAAVVAVGATPVFADVGADQCLDPAAAAAAVTPRTRAIMPVHLAGRMCDMPALMAVADRHRLLVVEDAAQAVGSTLDGRKAGSFGQIGCFSSHPLKNLNAAGDAGFITTSDPGLARSLRRLRNHGLQDRDTVPSWGFLSRMDALQAEILRFRLGRLPSVIQRRRANAAIYRDCLPPGAAWCPERPGEFATYHLFVVQVDQRDRLRERLRERGVRTAVHYPTPIHLQPAAAGLGYRPGAFPVCERQAARILSLPVHQFLEPDDLRYVADCLRECLAEPADPGPGRAG
jgi:dTDP-4-amino-4,6-dideoxygalactose transaminase